MASPRNWEKEHRHPYKLQVFAKICDVLPIKGYWKVDNDAVVCATSAVLVGGSSGKRFALPTICSQFFELGDSRYIFKADAADDEVVRAVPKATPATADTKPK